MTARLSEAAARLTLEPAAGDRAGTRFIRAGADAVLEHAGLSEAQVVELVRTFWAEIRIPGWRVEELVDRGAATAELPVVKVVVVDGRWATVTDAGRRLDLKTGRPELEPLPDDALAARVVNLTRAFVRSLRGR